MALHWNEMEPTGSRRLDLSGHQQRLSGLDTCGRIFALVGLAVFDGVRVMNLGFVVIVGRDHMLDELDKAEPLQGL